MRVRADRARGWCVGVCVMSDLEAAKTRLSFEDILEAVQDSKRGPLVPAGI